MAFRPTHEIVDTLEDNSTFKSVKLTNGHFGLEFNGDDDTVIRVTFSNEKATAAVRGLSALIAGGGNEILSDWIHYPITGKPLSEKLITQNAKVDLLSSLLLSLNQGEIESYTKQEMFTWFSNSIYFILEGDHDQRLAIMQKLDLPPSPQEIENKARQLAGLWWDKNYHVEIDGAASRGFYIDKRWTEYQKEAKQQLEDKTDADKTDVTVKV